MLRAFRSSMRGFGGFCLLFFFIFSATASYAQISPYMPAPGTMVGLSSNFEPSMARGIQIDPRDPFKLQFIMTPDKGLSSDKQRDEYQKLIKHFLASLTLPNDHMWVNLSPYEHERMIPEDFSRTEMGSELLAQDYLLKQLMASLIYPEKDVGRAFWNGIYQKAFALNGTTEIPVATFNKVWIVPDRAVVFEKEGTAVIVECHLKVMLDADYLAQSKQEGQDMKSDDPSAEISRQVMREIVIPELEREVNKGAHFAPLRQVYHSMILATWFKQTLKQSLLGEVYADRSRTVGVEQSDKSANEQIYQKYLEAFGKGAFNFIKEENDPYTKETIPRKYFSGGILAKERVQVIDSAQLTLAHKTILGAVALACVVVVAVLLPQEDPELKRYLKGPPQQTKTLKESSYVKQEAPFALLPEVKKVVREDETTSLGSEPERPSGIVLSDWGEPDRDLLNLAEIGDFDKFLTWLKGADLNSPAIIAALRVVTIDDKKDWDLRLLCAFYLGSSGLSKDKIREFLFIEGAVSARNPQPLYLSAFASGIASKNKEILKELFSDPYLSDWTHDLLINAFAASKDPEANYVLKDYTLKQLAILAASLAEEKAPQDLLVGDPSRFTFSTESLEVLAELTKNPDVLKEDPEIFNDFFVFLKEISESPNSFTPETPSMGQVIRNLAATENPEQVDQLLGLVADPNEWSFVRRSILEERTKIYGIENTKKLINSYLQQNGRDSEIEDLMKYYAEVIQGMTNAPVMESTQNQDDAQGTKGGIDLNEDFLSLVVRRDGNGQVLPARLQDPSLDNIQGLLPVIMQILPMQPALSSIFRDAQASGSLGM